MSKELKVKWCKKIAKIYETTEDPFVDKLIECVDMKDLKQSEIKK